ncbi:hypothetical protein Ga0058931_1241 [Roseibaca calidilacus]|uniref:Uncharacterized protein n=1 Tax=Roseibaca calidilacus TaxID=1666912 RepID=A0ABM9VSG5_9RHOB|nr:hypothetical protein Ga0058931_1241 [Roseibaca calidilacus]
MRRFKVFDLARDSPSLFPQAVMQPLDFHRSDQARADGSFHRHIPMISGPRRRKILFRTQIYPE